MNLLSSLESDKPFRIRFFRIKIKPYLEKLGILNTQTIREIGPLNTFINGAINMDSKGVIKLYKSLNSDKDSILTTIMNKGK